LGRSDASGVDRREEGERQAQQLRERPSDATVDVSPRRRCSRKCRGFTNHYRLQDRHILVPGTGRPRNPTLQTSAIWSRNLHLG
jgi:hypothetical protein